MVVGDQICNEVVWVDYQELSKGNDDWYFVENFWFEYVGVVVGVEDVVCCCFDVFSEKVYY